MTIDEDGPPCQGHCPNRGCLEVLASATGIMREANALADARPAGTLREARGGGAVLDARFVIEHARSGDAESLQVLETVGQLPGYRHRQPGQHLQPRGRGDRRRR